MMPQKEVNEANHQHVDPDYGRYEPEVRGGPSGKVYPLPRDNTNILCFSLAVIALGLILLFGLIFVVGVGGMTGWASFAVACIAILIIAGVGIVAIKTH